MSAHWHRKLFVLLWARPDISSAVQAAMRDRAADATFRRCKVHVLQQRLPVTPSKHIATVDVHFAATSLLRSENFVFKVAKT